MSETVQDESQAAAGWWQLDDAALVAALQQRRQLVRQAEAEEYAILAEIQARGTMTAYGYPSLEALQMDALRVGRAEAKRRTARALALHGTRALSTGEAATAAAPATALAAAEGAVGAEHIDVIRDVYRHIPDTTPQQEWEGYEKTFADLARVTGPQALRMLGRELIARLDQDGTEPTEPDPTPDRELQLAWRRDGRLALKGWLDPETGRLLQTVLSPVTKPRPEPDGTRDSRTPAQRNADGLAEILELVQREGQLPTEAGVKPTVTVTLDYTKLLEQLPAAATLNAAHPITGEQARRLACDSDILPAVLGTPSEQLDLGRSERLITRAQRRALNLRDKGCIFPGCTRTYRWTQGHHIRHWLHGGATNLSNLCLLCTEHHRLIHHSPWDITIADDGHPQCIPPPYIDPHQTPQRNHTHHPLE